MKRHNWTTLQRARIFLDNEGVCHICGIKIDGAKERWDLEHKRALGLGGEDVMENLAPAHVKCHRTKTDNDVTRISEAKRQQAKHIGAKPKHKWPSRPFRQVPYDNTKHIGKD